MHCFLLRSIFILRHLVIICVSLYEVLYLGLSVFGENCQIKSSILYLEYIFLAISAQVNQRPSASRSRNGSVHWDVVRIVSIWLRLDDGREVQRAA